VKPTVTYHITRQARDKARGLVPNQNNQASNPFSDW